MNLFFITLIAVVVLLVMAASGYVLIRRKMVSDNAMADFSKALLYICQPCLYVYTFLSLPRSVENLIKIGVFTALAVLINAIMLVSAFLILYKKSKEPIYRIITLATTFANCAFFGIPIIEAVMPSVASELIVYTMAYAFVMNILAWTVGSAIISHDRKYISLKRRS